MKKDLSTTTVVVVIGGVLAIVALVMIFGVWKPQIGAGPVVQPKPWRPNYVAPKAPGGSQGTPVAPYGGQPGGPIGAPGAPANGKK